MADYTITLTTEQDQALASATAAYNTANDATLTPTGYLTLRASDQLDALVRAHKERIRNKLTERFEQLTRQEQAALLQQLGISL